MGGKNHFWTDDVWKKCVFGVWMQQKRSGSNHVGNYLQKKKDMFAQFLGRRCAREVVIARTRDVIQGKINFVLVPNRTN